jgi:hypothetical protein
MVMKPVGWSVVCIGEWNLALFTPAAVSKSIFGLEPNTPIRA